MRLITLNKAMKLVILLGGMGAIFLLQMGSSQQSRASQSKPVIRRLDDTASIHKTILEKDVSDTSEINMAHRISTMRKSCAVHGLDKAGNDSLHQPNPWEYFINKRHNLIWCNVFKSGSSSLLYLFNKMAGYSDQTLKLKRMPPLTLARQKYPRPSKQELLDALRQKGAIAFLVARHPFQRLISGYRDKIVGALSGSLHHKLNRHILIKYRKLSPKDLQLPVRRMDRHQQRRRQLVASRLNGKVPTDFQPVKKLVPTFKEFVSFILDEVREGHELDMHWTPVYSFCNPCQVDFSHLVKFETFDQDSNDIVRAANLHTCRRPRANCPTKTLPRRTPASQSRPTCKC